MYVCTCMYLYTYILRMEYLAVLGQAICTLVVSGPGLEAGFGGWAGRSALEGGGRDPVSSPTPDTGCCDELMLVCRAGHIHRRPTYHGAGRRARAGTRTSHVLAGGRCWRQAAIESRDRLVRRLFTYMQMCTSLMCLDPLKMAMPFELALKYGDGNRYPREGLTVDLSSPCAPYEFG